MRYRTLSQSICSRRAFVRTDQSPLMNSATARDASIGRVEELNNHIQAPGRYDSKVLCQVRGPGVDRGTRLVNRARLFDWKGGDRCHRPHQTANNDALISDEVRKSVLLQSFCKRLPICI